MSTIETVAEVLRRLEALRELSVGALAEHLGRPKSTVSRLLEEMSRTDFLLRNDRKRRYAPGPLLLSAARHYPALLSVLREVRSQGYAESRDEGVPDVGGISVAVGPADQDAVALDAWSRAWPNRPAR